MGASRSRLIPDRQANPLRVFGPRQQLIYVSWVGVIQPTLRLPGLSILQLGPDIQHVNGVNYAYLCHGKTFG